MNEKRIDITVLGTLIGTASGWDDCGVCYNIYYNFEPNIDFALSYEVTNSIYSSISCNYDTGLLEFYNEAGDKVLFSRQLKLRMGV